MLDIYCVKLFWALLLFRHLSCSRILINVANLQDRKIGLKYYWVLQEMGKRTRFQIREAKCKTQDPKLLSVDCFGLSSHPPGVVGRNMRVLGNEVGDKTNLLSSTLSLCINAHGNTCNQSGSHEALRNISQDWLRK